ncbi:hypothetical protein B0H16DRAFT_1466305 [Mycena metata]|uniref:Uncharacterized protein n=1 Tax=Mycena metata TaxID=1033252 RepID=A0AAD7MY69_9AGAR|nr:hypothetical protein B0H16DRAFT_1466305 [Mycena metata]
MIVNHDHQRQLRSARGMMARLLAQPSQFLQVLKRVATCGSLNYPQAIPSSSFKPFLPQPTTGPKTINTQAPWAENGAQPPSRARGTDDIVFVGNDNVANVVKGRILAITHYIISSVAHFVMALKRVVTNPQIS